MGTPHLHICGRTGGWWGGGFQGPLCWSTSLPSRTAYRAPWAALGPASAVPQCCLARSFQSSLRCSSAASQTLSPSDMASTPLTARCREGFWGDSVLGRDRGVCGGVHRAVLAPARTSYKERRRTPICGKEGVWWCPLRTEDPCQPRSFSSRCLADLSDLLGPR